MQEYNSGYPDAYHLTLDIVFRQSVYFSPLISLPRIIYLEPIYQIEDFTFGYRLDIARFYIYPVND